MQTKATRKLVKIKLSHDQATLLHDILRRTWFPDVPSYITPEDIQFADALADAIVVAADEAGITLPRE